MISYNVLRIIRKIRNFWLDMLYAGKSLQDISARKSKDVYSGHASDYLVISAIFDDVPVDSKDSFIDVGCGKGRVLLYISRKFKPTTITGYELDKSTSNVAIDIGKSAGFSVLNESVFCSFPSDGTYFYLFNPFEKQMLVNFLELVAKTRFRVLIYYNPPAFTEEDIEHFLNVLMLNIETRYVKHFLLPDKLKVSYIVITKKCPT